MAAAAGAPGSEPHTAHYQKAAAIATGDRGGGPHDEDTRNAYGGVEDYDEEGNDEPGKRVLKVCFCFPFSPFSFLSGDLTFVWWSLYRLRMNRPFFCFAFVMPFSLSVRLLFMFYTVRIWGVCFVLLFSIWSC
jgi:hypothetical protein